MSESDDGIPELTESEQIRIRAAESDFAAMGDALRSGTATAEGVEGAFARLMALDIDPHRHRNALHIPADAGSHAPALEIILRRIPDGWGRWISVAAGWYPLVVATDHQLAAIDADYVVHQIKEKFGTLRYCCAPSSDDPSPELLDALDAITDGAERAPRSAANAAANPGCCTEPGTGSKRCAILALNRSVTHLCRRTWCSSS